MKELCWFCVAPWKGQRVCCFPFIGKADRCITQRSAPSLPQPAGQTASPRFCLGFHLCTSQTPGKGWEPAHCPVSISFPPLQQRLMPQSVPVTDRCWLVSRNHRRVLRRFFLLLCCVLRTMLRRNALASCLMAEIQRNNCGLGLWLASLVCCLTTSCWAAPR